MRKRFISVTTLVLILLSGTAITLAALSRPQSTIVDGVHVAGMDWSNKPVSIARAELEGWRKARLESPLILSLPAETRIVKRWNPTFAELGADVDLNATVDQADSIGQKEGALTRLVSWFSRRKSVDLAPTWHVDPAKLAAYLKRSTAPSVYTEPHDARFLALKEGFKIVPEQPGARLDLEGAVKEITDRISGSSAEPVVLPVKTTPPHVTEADLKGIEGEVSRFNTHYSETGNRSRNIRTACGKINGTVLKPGDRFSYNKIVGPRDEESGFRVAPVIVSGKLVPGMGGGVCQVSSTLYNAVLMADLKIVRREHHAFPVHYLPAGRDATVVYGSIDFQFENNTDRPIAVAASGEGQQVLFRIFGRPDPNRQVLIERTNVSSWGAGEKVVRDSGLPAGKRSTLEKGHAGHRVTVWRVVRRAHKQVKRELLSHDYYSSFPRVVVVGTRPVAPKPPAEIPAPGVETQPAPAPPAKPGLVTPQEPR